MSKLIQERKIYRLLQTFSRYEQEQFEDFLMSPLHNQDAIYHRLYQLFQPALKNGAIISHDTIRKKLFPRKLLTNQDYARLFSKFGRKIEHFLSLRKFIRDDSKQHIAILEIFNERGLHAFFNDRFTFAYEKLKLLPQSDGLYFHMMQLEALRYDHLETLQQRSSNKNLLETLHALDRYYIATKLRYCAALLHYQSFLSLSGEVAMLNELMEYCQQRDWPDAPLIEAYYRIVNLLIDPESANNYKQLRHLLFEKVKLFSTESLHDLYPFAINYCIIRINAGHQEYQHEIFEWYKRGLQTRALFTGNFLSHWDFKNIVTVALRNKETGWAIKFIETHAIYLKKEERSNAEIFNKARYYFAIKKYGEVLKLLQGVEYTDIFYQLDSKTTLMKTYYELDEYQPLLSLKESFRILLRRKRQITPQNQANYSNFARLLMKLYRLDVSKKSAVQKLKQEIAHSTNVADKGWLLEKLEELGA